MKFIFLAHYLRCLSKGNMDWNLCPILQQNYLLEEHHQHWILTASWLITYIVIAYQKWQVFTVRDASYYKQKPCAAFLLVIKQASTFVRRGRKKKKAEVCNIMIPISPSMSSKTLTGTKGNFFRNILESAGSKSRAFPIDRAETFHKIAVAFSFSCKALNTKEEHEH